PFILSEDTAWSHQGDRRGHASGCEKAAAGNIRTWFRIHRCPLLSIPSISQWRRGLTLRELPGLKSGNSPYATAFAEPLKNASRSALIVSASVVGMPCGKPL